MKTPSSLRSIPLPMGLERALIGILAALVVSTFVHAQEHTGPATLAELQQRLSNHVSQPRFAAALWGVKVVSLDSGKTLFEHHAQKLFSPASNSKLYTVALGLVRLGADYRIKTSLYSSARPDQAGLLKSDLIVYGRGDPTINARLHGNDIYEALEPLVAVLTNARISRIEGDLVADESFFHGPPIGSGWAWDDLENYYGAEISALTINDNTLQIAIKPGAHPGDRCQLALSPATAYVVLSNRTETATAGTNRSISLYRPLNENVIYVTGKMPVGGAEYKDDVTIHHPAGLFAAFLREALLRHGIKVAGRIRSLDDLENQSPLQGHAKLIELGAVESPPLSEIAREIMKPSQNLYTDLLLAHVGELQRNPATARTSEALGIRELDKFLDEVGVKKGDVLFEEGSGLSRNNLTTPNATIALLQYMNRHKWAEVFLNSLPIAGVDGTLRNRMKGTAAAGNVRAKTGTLRWANSIAGHVTTRGGERLIFCVMLNRYHSSGPGSSARSDLDVIPVLLASFSGRPDKQP